MSRKALALCSLRVIRHSPVTCGSSTSDSPCLLIMRLAKPIGPRWSAHVAGIPLRKRLLGRRDSMMASFFSCHRSAVFRLGGADIVTMITSVRGIPVRAATTAAAYPVSMTSPWGAFTVNSWGRSCGRWVLRYVMLRAINHALLGRLRGFRRAAVLGMSGLTYLAMISAFTVLRVDEGTGWPPGGKRHVVTG